MLTVYGGLIIGVPLSSDASSDIQSDNDTPLPGEPGSPYLDIGDAEDDVVKFFKDLEALFRRNAVIDNRAKGRLRCALRRRSYASGLDRIFG